MATALAVTNKNEQANLLRVEVAALTKDLSGLREKLTHANEVLAALEDKRREFAESAADGRPQKSTVVAALHAEIAEAGLPVESLQKRVTEKQSVLEQTRSRLETLQREISIETHEAALQARFDSLAREGEAVVGRISGHVRALLEDFYRYDEARDAIGREFVSLGTAHPLGRRAREVVAQFGGALFDGQRFKSESDLLRSGWEPRADISVMIRNLRPKR